MTKLLVAFRNSANVSNNVNADQRFVEEFSYQCSRDVKFPLKMADNNLNNFSGFSVFAFYWWLVVNKAVFLANLGKLYLKLLLGHPVHIFIYSDMFARRSELYLKQYCHSYLIFLSVFFFSSSCILFIPSHVGRKAILCLLIYHPHI
jgi:hypothetical protein